MSAAEDRQVSPEVLDGVMQTMEAILERALTSADEDFFYLGGRSMTLMVLLTRVRKKFGVAVLPRAFLKNPTAAGLAALVEQSLAGKPPGEHADERHGGDGGG